MPTAGLAPLDETITIAELTRAGQLLAISTFQNGTVYVLSLIHI